jgi:F0F1-type ATP synthase assembly protein I
MAEDDKKKSKWGYAPMLLEVGFEISLPLVAFVLVGIWLDRKLNTGHLFLFVGIGLSLISSTAALYDTYKKIRVAEGAEEERK